MDPGILNSASRLPQERTLPPSAQPPSAGKKSTAKKGTKKKHRKDDPEKKEELFSELDPFDFPGPASIVPKAGSSGRSPPVATPQPKGTPSEPRTVEGYKELGINLSQEDVDYLNGMEVATPKSRLALVEEKADLINTAREKGEDIQKRLDFNVSPHGERGDTPQEFSPPSPPSPPPVIHMANFGPIRYEEVLDKKHGDRADQNLSVTPGGPTAPQKPLPARPEAIDENQDDITPVGEDLEGEQLKPLGEKPEEKKHQPSAAPTPNVADVVARETARALAGLQLPRNPQEPAAGYLGNRNVGNRDILNSNAGGTAAFTNKAGKLSGIPLGERGGDAFVDAKQSRNTTTDTLRPNFGIAPNDGVIPNKRSQIESEVLFSEFSIVAPGHGLGVTNKMFLMEQDQDAKIRFAEPLAEPRSDQGPSGCVQIPRIEFQNQISRRDRALLQERELALESAAVLLEARAGRGSLNIMGDDFGLLQSMSDKGLKRPREIPLEPILRKPKAMERTRVPAGVQMQSRHMRYKEDALRYPERFQGSLAQKGGPTMSRGNALAVFAFPITAN